LRRKWIPKWPSFKISSFKEIRSWTRAKKKFNFYLGIVLLFCVFIFLGYAVVYKAYDLRQKKEITHKKEIIVKEEKGEEKKLLPKKIFKGKVAIILDDAGEDLPELDRLLAIKSPITVSILPFLPTSGKVALKVKEASKEVMLHLPMEPENGKYVRADGAMILEAMDDISIRRIVEESLKSVPYARGVNNHMGSKATQSRRVMENVLLILKDRELFFIDSRTSRNSIAHEAARELGVPSSENYIFLDVDTSPEVIEKKLEELVFRADRTGHAIGIGHVTRSSTIDVLKKKMPEYEEKGVEFVFASELVK